MDFDTLVTFFKDWSGRVDLDDETVAHYLNAGQRFLDDFCDFQQNPSRYIYAGAIGQSYLSLDAQAKVISKIKFIDSLGTVSDVVEVSLKELQMLSDTLPSYKPNALPTYFAMANQKNVGQTVPIIHTGKLAVETGLSSEKLGILFDCPMDQVYTVDIYGKFFSPEILEGDDPDTFWASQYPFTLIHSALFKLEISYRNSEGANDWLMAIKADMSGIDKNVAEQTSTNSTQMEG
jgi:hypothetical protein